MDKLIPCGDSACTGQKVMLKEIVPEAKDFTNKRAFALLALINVEKWGRPLTGGVRPA